VACLFVAVFVLSAFVLGGFIAPVSAQGAPQIVLAQNTTMLYSPSMPVWNVFAASNFVTTNPQTSDPPLMWYNSLTGAFFPGLATGISEFPSNNSFIVYLRKGLQWYNGSATMPFTAWDVYTYFYIEAKVFQGYEPYLNASKIRVLNNYTIEFTLNEWAPTVPGLLVQNIIGTPYEVWKPILENVTSMSEKQATGAADYVERFIAPPWFLGPYYTTVSVPYAIMHLDPPNLLQEWATVFPYHTWQDYNPEVIWWWTGGGGQTLDGIIAHKVSWIQCGMSPAQFKTAAASGFIPYLKYGYMGDFNMIINPAVYPLNITNVRLALAYAVNRTEMVDSWNADNMTLYVPWTYAGFWPNYASLPKWIYKDMYNFTTNLTKATQLLESAGLYKKNGQWYLPNGQPFKLTFTVINGWLDTATEWENAASQLTEFGIPTTVLSTDADTFYGTEMVDGDFEIGMYWSAETFSYPSSWSLGNWWWLTGYTASNGTSLYSKGWNSKANYPIIYPNGTKGVFNMTTWFADFERAVPGSAEFNATIAQALAFLGSQMPGIPVVSKTDDQGWSPITFNATWIMALPRVPQTSFFVGISPGLLNADTGGYWMTLLGVAPPGVQSPLAEAIATDSVSPEMAAFLGLPSSYSANYEQSQLAGALSSAKVSLTVNPTTLNVGSSTLLRATVTYANGTPAPNVSVEFLASGAKIGSNTTGTNGQATLTYTPSAVGTQTLLASLVAHPSTMSNTVTLNVTSMPTPTPTPTTSSSTMLYAIVVVVVVVIVVVVAGLLAMTRRGKKGPQQQK